MIPLFFFNSSSISMFGSSGFSWFSWVLLVVILKVLGLHFGRLVLLEFSWSSPGSPGSPGVLLGSSGVSWVLLEFSWFSWVLLGSLGCSVECTFESTFGKLHFPFFFNEVAENASVLKFASPVGHIPTAEAGVPLCCHFWVGICDGMRKKLRKKGAK